MDDVMKGLFGGGDEGNERANRAQDFIQRYEDGGPDTGFEEQEAYSQVNDLIKYADSGQVERATRQALERMPESERSKFGEYFGQMQGGGAADVDQISKMFGERGGPAQSADDLFGGLFGGGGGGGAEGGGGLGGMLGGLLGGGGSSGSSGAGGMLGGLLGGGDNDNRQSGGGGGGLGGMLGGSAGKMLMGGIAAYLMKELMGGRR